MARSSLSLSARNFLALVSRLWHDHLGPPAPQPEPKVPTHQGLTTLVIRHQLAELDAMATVFVLTMAMVVLGLMAAAIAKLWLEDAPRGAGGL